MFPQSRPSRRPAATSTNVVAAATDRLCNTRWDDGIQHMVLAKGVWGLLDDSEHSERLVMVCRASYTVAAGSGDSVAARSYYSVAARSPWDANSQFHGGWVTLILACSLSGTKPCVLNPPRRIDKNLEPRSRRPAISERRERTNSLQTCCAGPLGGFGTSAEHKTRYKSIPLGLIDETDLAVALPGFCSSENLCYHRNCFIPA